MKPPTSRFGCGNYECVACHGDTAYRLNHYNEQIKALGEQIIQAESEGDDFGELAAERDEFIDYMVHEALGRDLLTVTTDDLETELERVRAIEPDETSVDELVRVLEDEVKKRKALRFWTIHPAAHMADDDDYSDDQLWPASHWAWDGAGTWYAVDAYGRAVEAVVRWLPITELPTTGTLIYYSPAFSKVLKVPTGDKPRMAAAGECQTCDYWRSRGDGIFPAHNASSRCQSGGRNHCTCDACF